MKSEFVLKPKSSKYSPEAPEVQQKWNKLFTNSLLILLMNEHKQGAHQILDYNHHFRIAYRFLTTRCSPESRLRGPVMFTVDQHTSPLEHRWIPILLLGEQGHQRTNCLVHSYAVRLHHQLQVEFPNSWSSLVWPSHAVDNMLVWHKVRLQVQHLPYRHMRHKLAAHSFLFCSKLQCSWSAYAAEFHISYIIVNHTNLTNDVIKKTCYSVQCNLIITWPFITRIRHSGLVGSAPAWDGTGCEFDSWQCRIYIPCSLSLRLLGSLRGSLGTYGLTQKFR